MDELELEFVKRSNDAYDIYENTYDETEEAVLYAVHETWANALRLLHRFKTGQPLDIGVV